MQLISEAIGNPEWDVFGKVLIVLITVMCTKGADAGIKWFREFNSTSVVREKLQRGGEKAAFEYLEGELKELRMQLVKVNSDHTQCLVTQTRLQTELNFAKEEILELQAKMARRPDSDSKPA